MFKLVSLITMLLFVEQGAKALELKTAMIQVDPWAFESEDKANGPYAGIVVDFIKEFEKRSGFKVTAPLTPYARVENDLKDGAIDFSVMAWGPQRAEYADKLTEFFTLEFGVLPAKGVEIKTYEDLKKISISVTRGLKVEPKFDDDASLASVKELDLDYTTGVKKVIGGRVKAVAGAMASLRYILKKMNVEDKFGEPFVLKTTVAAVAYSKKSGKYANKDEVKKVFDAILADGTAKAIEEKWLGKKSGK